MTNQNEKGMTLVWSIIIFGPRAPFVEYVLADSREEAVVEAQKLHPTQVVSEWADRDIEMEAESREIVLNALEEAAYDAYQAVSKRKNGRI